MQAMSRQTHRTELGPRTLAYYAMRRRQKTARYWERAGAGSSRGAGLSVEG